MILLDNGLYVLNACSRMSQNPGYRIIPLGISCLTGESLIVTSVINLIAIYFSLVILFRTFKFDNKTSIFAAVLFSLNSYVAFPFFYAAAHSYVYTIFAVIVALFCIEKFEKLNLKTVPIILLCGVLLKLVRSEGALYFGMGLIAYLIFNYLNKENIKSFLQFLKQKISFIILLIFFISIFNFLVQIFISSGEEITKNLSTASYNYQFPKESFKAVSMWATLDYLRSFLTPYHMNFFGDYLDWLKIHKDFNVQVVLYSILGIITLVSIYFIIKRKKNSISYFIIGLSIFIIPGFLISSFLRNQWYYPSRSLLGCFLSIPFFTYAVLNLKNKKWIKPISWSLFIFYFATFIIHNIMHFNNEKTMYEYEHKILGISHPTLSKMYAQSLFKEINFLEGTKVLRESGRSFPEEGIFLSANHFFLWAENLYWSAAGSYYYKSPLTEEKVLEKLYSQPNYFGALACLQDLRVPIESCYKRELLGHLCHPVYRKRFGFTYYKKPRMTGEQACSKFQALMQK